MQRHTLRRVCLLAGVVLLVPGISRAQSSLSLVDQLREIDAVLAVPQLPASPGTPPPPISPEAAKIRDFRNDPWNNTPTVDEIKQAFGQLNAQLGAAQGAIEGTPFFSESAIINGLTDFVINRAKDEVSLTFLIDLRDRIAADPLLSILFKQTLVVAAQLEATSAKQLLGPLRSAATADVRAIPETLLKDDSAIDALEMDIERHLSSREDIDKLKAAICAFKENRASLNLLARSLRDLVNGVPPMTTLASYADLTPMTFEKPADVRYGLITIGTLAREYRWAPKMTRDLLADPDERTRFLALLRRDLLDSQTGEKTSVDQWAKKVQCIERQLNDVLAAFDVTVQAVDALRTAQSADSKIEAFGNVANAALQIIAAARPFVPDTDKWDDIAKKITHINRLQVAVVGRDYVTAITEANLVLTDFGVSYSLPNGVLKSLTFAATLAGARTSEEVTAAIQTAAVPVLSFRVKRTRAAGESASWVGVNAYVGGSAGVERTASTNSNKVGFGGLTVPIGVEVGTPLTNPVVKSVSLFVPLIDVGTVASFRLKSSDLDQPPALTFSQIVAPGAFAVFGITQRYPISVGVGTQFVPKLRRAEGSGDNLFDMMRYGVFVAVDVPIFRF